MSGLIENMFAQQLEERKLLLQAAASKANDPRQIKDLLADVDRALAKITAGSYGLCENCRDPIEPERLAFDPMTRYCLDHLSEIEQRALERDIDLARQIQNRLLPARDLVLRGWDSYFHYEPSGQVSGDYCDIIPIDNPAKSFYFIVGDVTGKGIAASLLMSQLHAMFRTLAGSGLSLSGLMDRINRLFCEASLTTHFATLVCGFAHETGEIEISNAGHCLPLVIREEGIERLFTSDLPLGVACETSYRAETKKLRSGESLFIYTDGLTESAAQSGELYGDNRLMDLLNDVSSVPPMNLIESCLDDLTRFSGESRKRDDLTLMALRKE